MKTIVLAVLCLSLMATAAVWAHEAHKSKPRTTTPTKTVPSAPAARVQPVTLKGELVDPQCWFMHDGQGKAHRECAVTCARGGQTLALLESSSGLIYTIIAGAHGKDPNQGLFKHVGVPVTVKGTAFSRGTNHALLVQSVQPLK